MIQNMIEFIMVSCDFSLMNLTLWVLKEPPGTKHKNKRKLAWMVIKNEFFQGEGG